MQGTPWPRFPGKEAKAISRSWRDGEGLIMTYNLSFQELRKEEDPCQFFFFFFLMDSERGREGAGEGRGRGEGDRSAAYVPVG